MIMFLYLFLLLSLEFFTLSVYLITFTYILFYVILYLNKTEKVIVSKLNVSYNFVSVYTSITLFLKNVFKKTSRVLSVSPYTHLRWKPLFKKSSYYGLYRANKNQWLNK